MMNNIRTKVRNQHISNYHGLKAVVKGSHNPIISNYYGHNIVVKRSPNSIISDNHHIKAMVSSNNQGLQAVVNKSPNERASALNFSSLTSLTLS
jgi:hypothetical protein